MNKSLPVLLALLSISVITSGQTITSIQKSLNAITIDGVASSGEWDLAPSLSIDLGGSQTVEVRMVHDDNQLCFLFSGPLESSNALFPEVLLDMDHDTTAQWNTDDWWFHVSAQDCEWQGAYGDYNNCDTTQPDWTGLPNFTMGPPQTDTVEIGVPFSKIGLSSELHRDTFGLAVLVTNTFNNWKIWPANADHNSPATWAGFTIGGLIQCLCPVPIPQEFGKVYPNPAHDYLNVLVPENHKELVEVIIADVSGRPLKHYTSTEFYDLYIGDLKNGIYLVQVSTPTMQVTRKLVLQK